MFEGSATGGYQGDIAFDDVLFTDGACPFSGKSLFCLFFNTLLIDTLEQKAKTWIDQ